MATKKTTKKTVEKTAPKKVTSSARVTRPTAKTARVSAPRKKEVSKKENFKEESLSSDSKMVDFMKNKRVLYTLAGLLGLGLILFATSKYLTVAWVDGKPVTRFELYNDLDKRYGKDLTEELIVEKLLLSEASKNNVNVTNPEIDAEIKKIEDQQGGQAQLQQILTAQNISQDDFHKLIKLQLVKQKLFGKDVKVEDASVEAYLQQNQASLPPTDPNDASSAAKLKESVKEQLTQQKVNDNFNKWLTDALKSARVSRAG